jgi:type II secretory pathway component PulF
MVHVNDQNASPIEWSLVSAHWGRCCVYVVAWLPPFGFLLCCIPRFGPVFQRLDEKGELPELTRWVWAFIRLNQDYYYLPAMLTLVTLFAIGELLIVGARNTWLRRITWGTVVASVGILAWFINAKTLMLPAFTTDNAG